MEPSARLDAPGLTVTDAAGRWHGGPGHGGPGHGGPGHGGLQLSGELPTDEQLAELALAAPAESPLPPDARPFLPAGGATAFLPSWYMPAVATRRATPAQRAVVVSIVVALLVLEALGLCSVFGQVVIG